MSTNIEIATPLSLDTAPEPLDVPAPIPMSFPAVLRNPKLADRFAHLRIAASVPGDNAPIQAKKDSREDREGKRWVRRRDNARFAGNPHIVVASKGDYSLTLPDIKATFPEPLPPYLPRNSSVSSISPPTPQDPNSSNAGRFSLSLKGMRKELRKSGARAQYLVHDVESAMVTWLQEGGVLLSPDSFDNELNFPGTAIGASESIYEVGKTPLQLVWSIEDDAFARYVVHCCARYHQVVSFSKDVSGQRLTYLLRPNVTRPDHTAAASLDTPPVTDFDYSSHGDLESEPDLTSDREALESSGEMERPQSALSTVSETSPSNPTYRYRAVPAGELSEDEWSVIGADTDVDLSGSEIMSRDDAPDVDGTPQANPDATRPSGYAIRQSPLSRVWERRTRSSSSPSRSPARRPFRRVIARVDPPRPSTAKSFYEYLFADRVS